MNSYTTILVSAIVMTSFVAMITANPTHSTCASEEYQCQGNHECIPVEWVCDGGEDCDGGDDERQDCENRRVSCDAGFWQCQSGVCIPESWKCDKDDDCDDGSDEQGCTYVPETRRQRLSHQHMDLSHGNN